MAAALGQPSGPALPQRIEGEARFLFGFATAIGVGLLASGSGVHPAPGHEPGRLISPARQV